jgi:hypothetical protein
VHQKTPPSIEAIDKVIGPPNGREHGRVCVRVCVSGIVRAFRGSVIVLRAAVGDIDVAIERLGAALAEQLRFALET